MSSKKKKKDKSGALESFGTNLNQKAKNGDIDPVIGREEEIKRIEQVLQRRKKNNPVLLGHAGVGKSAIVEGIARKIVNGDMSQVLEDKIIISIEMNNIVAGTKYRGQFEERVKAIIKETQERDDVILFIDEIHTITGAGNSIGGVDFSNVFKPSLANGDIQCIGATTYDEYRENIENDNALERRFQKVTVKEPTLEETKDILMQAKELYEDHHSVSYDEKIIDQIVQKSNRYITSRYFPDKAIDVLDEVGSSSFVSYVKDMQDSEKIEKLNEKSLEFANKKKHAVEKQDYETAATFRDKENKIKREIEEIRDNIREKMNGVNIEIKEENVNQVISMLTGIPLEKMEEEERDMLMNLSDTLKGHVIGQDHACERIASCVIRSRANVKAPNRPDGVFLFTGPSGVGKTYLSKTLANTVYGENSLIRFDMSEYSEQFNATRMVGSPPGYVGHSEGGQLTERIRRNPYSVVLLDEIEKAHPRIFNMFLQVFDEGHMTDGLGRKVDFRNTIIIMTSNIGARKIIKRSSGSDIGFASNTNDTTNKDIQSIVKNEIKNNFAPEFLNRIDETFVFNTISKEDMESIVEQHIHTLKERLKNQNNVAIKFTNPAKNLLAEKGHSLENGVRPLKRVIRSIEEKIAARIIETSVDDIKYIKVRSSNDSFITDVEYHE